MLFVQFDGFYNMTFLQVSRVDANGRVWRDSRAETNSEHHQTFSCRDVMQAQKY